MTSKSFNNKVKLNDIVSVTDFGAVGDGVTDDTAAIQAALAASLHVVFPEGDYIITSALTLRDYHNVEGLAGRGGSNIYATGCSVFTGNGAEQISIKNFRLYGDETAGTFGVYIYNCPRGAHLESIYADNFGDTTYDGTLGTTSGAGFKLEFECWGSRLIGLAAERCAAGIILDSASASAIIAGSVRQNGGPALVLRGCNGTSVNGGVFEKAQPAYGAVATKGYSVQVLDSNNISLSGVYTEQSIDGAIKVDGSENVTISSCLMDGVNTSVEFGLLYLKNSTNVTCASCYIEGLDSSLGPGKACIYVDATSSNNTFISNELERDGGVGSGNYTIYDLGSNNVYINNKGATGARVGSTNTNLSGVYAQGPLIKSSRDALSQITIAGGSVTVTGHYHSIATEGGASTDDLDTINGGYDGQRVVFRAADTTDTVVVKHNTGNIRLQSGGDFSLDSWVDTVELIYDDSLSVWLEVGRTNIA